MNSHDVDANPHPEWYQRLSNYFPERELKDPGQMHGPAQPPYSVPQVGDPGVSGYVC